MEGRTKFNYGMKNYILTMKDLKYMLEIVDSDLSDQDKAAKLNAFCNYFTLLNNLRNNEKIIIKNDKSRKYLTDILTRLVHIYQEYEKKGYFNLLKNPYKCTIEEMEVRLSKINEVSAILNSNDSDYSKAYKLIKLFDSAESFRKSYALFVKYGKTDSRLNKARQALDSFDLFLAKFRELEQKGIIANVKYFLSNEDYFQNYNYAKFIILSYINSTNSYKETEFLEELGIDKDIFNYCTETVEELDVDLYDKYLAKKETNMKIRYIKNIQVISDLANGIKTGLLSDGTPFDLLEFIKRVPFKKYDFVNVISDFMKRNNPQDFEIIMSYIYTNKLNSVQALSPINLNNIYYTKTIINGTLITNKDNDIIIEYLRLRKIPLVNKAYLFARTKYLNGEITAEMIQTLREQVNNKTDLKEKARILIPSKLN